ncbi:MAG TPA: hypothetical protein VD735_04685 [Candidatus Saccharimonadales bacterium]|nr:hypothetical protein [Candidatus Saccharimonadales bacterium]
MQHRLSGSEQAQSTIISIILTLLPLILIAIGVVMLIDWHHHAKTERRYLWLLLIIFAGLVGYALFYFSNDRVK